MVELILLKIGGSIITKKSIQEPKIDSSNLKRISSEIAEVYKGRSFKLIIVHGAGSFGHPIVKRTGIHEGIIRQDQIFSFAETQLLQNRLNVEICQVLQEFNLPAIPIQPSASAIMENKRLISLNYNLIGSLLDLSLIPVLFGVPAFDKEQKCSILSGDQIIAYLAKQYESRYESQTIIFASNVDGIFGKNQQLIEKITNDNYEQIKDTFYQAIYDDVTGSMAGKISELENLKGIKSYIINGTKKNIIKKILSGQKVRGTVIEF
ncbi:MAG: isopentenyl phosphate kinase [Promethearchaeota archaeon]